MDIDITDRIQHDIHVLSRENERLKREYKESECHIDIMENKLEEQIKEIDDLKMLISYYEKRFF